MFKNMLTVLLVIAVIIFIGLGVSNEAKAGDYTCKNFTITLKSVEGNSGNQIFNYEITGAIVPINKISFFGLGINKNFGLTMLVENTDGSITTTLPNEPGAGSSDGWLAGVPQLQVVVGTPQTTAEASPVSISVSGIQIKQGLIAAYTKAGNKIESCFIDGPVLEPVTLPIDVTVPATKQVSILGVDYCIDIDPLTGCPIDDIVYICGTEPKTTETKDDNGNIISPLPYDDSFVIGSESSEYNSTTSTPVNPTMIMGEGSDPRCPVAKAAHNPCQWVILSGRPYGPICW